MPPFNSPGPFAVKWSILFARRTFLNSERICLNIWFIEGRKKSYEVIVVDDGSKDTTSEVAQGRGTPHFSTIL